MRKAILILMIFLPPVRNPRNQKTIPGIPPPDDHTVNEDGARHEPGLNAPYKNCISCHGSGLKGSVLLRMPWKKMG